MLWIGYHFFSSFWWSDKLSLFVYSSGWSVMCTEVLMYFYFANSAQERQAMLNNLPNFIVIDGHTLNNKLLLWLQMLSFFLFNTTKSRTLLSDFTFTFHFHALEKEMATHSSVLAWRIPGTVEPDGLPSTGSHRVGHDKWLSSSSNLIWGEGNGRPLQYSYRENSMDRGAWGLPSMHRVRHDWSELAAAAVAAAAATTS